MPADPPIFEAAFQASRHPRPAGRHQLTDPSFTDTTQEFPVPKAPQPPYIRRPRAANPASLTPRQVAAAYNAPITRYDGTGVVVGIIELGGAYTPTDLTKVGGNPAMVTVVGVDGAFSKSDPNGADGEVELDVEVVATIAPGAKVRVYFAPNTDQGFLNATRQASNECDVVSISWGGPESQWSAASMKSFSAVISAARQRGVPVFVAAGDNGSTDGTKFNVVDFPASAPDAVGCGGTRLMLDANGQRSSETVWNDDPTSSATGGGVSRVFPGRQVPDIAGNADPDTGYRITVDGQDGVIGGTSAVAPLYAGCYALLKQAYGKSFDFVNTVATNPAVCFDVTDGNNGGYKAGPGRDNVAGYGVVDFGKLLAVLTSGTQIPAPGGGSTPPPPATTPDHTALQAIYAIAKAALRA